MQAQAATVSHSHGVEAAHGTRTSKTERSWGEKAAVTAVAMALVT